MMEDKKRELLKEIVHEMDALVKPTRGNTTCPICGKEAKNGLVYDLTFYHVDCLKKRNEITRK